MHRTLFQDFVVSFIAFEGCKMSLNFLAERSRCANPSAAATAP